MLKQLKLALTVNQSFFPRRNVQIVTIMRPSKTEIKQSRFVFVSFLLYFTCADSEQDSVLQTLRLHTYQFSWAFVNFQHLNG